MIAECAAREAHGERAGRFVLTTQRALFVVDDDVAWEIQRSDIAHVQQRVNELWIYRDGRSPPGVGFILASAMAGPVRWAWYLDDPAPGRGELLGVRDDPRLGLVDAARRTMLDDWRKMLEMVTLSPFLHYLDGLPEVPVKWREIVEIVHIADGRGDGPAWLLVVRFADGRWAYFSHVVEITGDMYTTMIVAASLASLWWGAFTEEERDRFTAQVAQERLDEELVQLDALLESPDAHVRAHAEHRMLQIRERRGSS